MRVAVDSSETFSGFEESMTKRPIHTDQHHSELAFHRFSLLREKQILTDAVIFSNDGKRFNVHSFIMSGTSDYFFNNLVNANGCNSPSDCIGSNNNQCQLNIDSLALEMIITFCYSGAIELTVENVENVLVGAKELEIESLMLVCSEMLEEILDMNNCIRMLELADKNGLESLRALALELVSEEMPQIDKLPEFYHMDGSQMLWLIELLSNIDDGIFGALLSSIYTAERSFSALKSVTLNADMQSAFRAAFIVGFFEGEKFRSSQAQLSLMQNDQQQSDTDTDAGSSTSTSTKSTQSDFETEPDTGDKEQASPPVHVLSLMKSNTIQSFILCETEKKWKRLSMTRVELTHTIDSFRDAIMIPVRNQIVIFHMKNGFISQARLLTAETAHIGNVTLPNDIDRSELALFCPLNDTIYCFSRTDQQFFHSFDSISKVWSTGQIEDVKDAKYIVGLKDELYFIGCGFDRKAVRSYHIGRKEWTDRGNLQYDKKEACFKAIALGETIYVVMSCYGSNSVKMYNDIEFIVQRFDNDVNDWVIIQRIYHSRFGDYFNLEVVENCLYLFYGDDEVHIYNEERDEWRKGPPIDYKILDVTMCMVAVKSNEW